VVLDAASAEGLLPLDYMLKVMRDEAADRERRDDMARAAAPYLHNVYTVNLRFCGNLRLSSPPQVKPFILTAFLTPARLFSLLHFLNLF
jgi:hypothetical protein